jgi:hypothetical protein
LSLKLNDDSERSNYLPFALFSIDYCVKNKLSYFFSWIYLGLSYFTARFFPDGTIWFDEFIL